MQDGFVLAINPTQLKNPEAAYNQLAKIIMLDRETFLAKAVKGGDPYEELVNRLDAKIAAAVQ